MRKFLKISGLTLLVIATIIYVLYYLGYIAVGTATFEKKEQIKIVNNSVFETANHFCENKELEKYKGKTIFFNSWATWCGPCVKEIPTLNFLKNKYTSDTNIVFISYCSNLESSKVDSLLKEDRELTFNFQKIDAKNGLRMSLRKLAVEQNNYKDIDTTKDLVPMNIIIDKYGKIIKYMSSIEMKDTTEIYKSLQH